MQSNKTLSENPQTCDGLNLEIGIYKKIVIRYSEEQKWYGEGNGMLIDMGYSSILCTSNVFFVYTLNQIGTKDIYMYVFIITFKLLFFQATKK